MRQWENDTIVSILAQRGGGYKVLELPARHHEIITSRRSFRSWELAEGHIANQYPTALTLPIEDIREEAERRAANKDKPMRGLLNDMHPHVDMVEKEIVLTIIEDALKRGYQITVYDGVEITADRSDNEQDVFGAMFGTGKDMLFFYQNGRQAGWVLLINGNRESIISDYSDNAAMNNLLKNADKLAERYS